MSETNLRQAETNVTVEGLVSEMNLEEKKDNNGVNVITGSVTIKTSDVNFVRLSVYSKEKKNDGTENSVYPGIKTVMTEYKTIANDGEDVADYVRVRGQLNLYHNTQRGTDDVSYRASFFTRMPRKDEYDDFDGTGPHAEFDVEMFVNSVVPETGRDGDETGRLMIKGWVPSYNGIDPLTLVAGEDIADAVDNLIAPGQTVKFFGELVNNRIETKVEIPVVIGKPKIEKRVSYKNELLITGVEEPYEEGGTVKPYKAEVIKAAIQERNNDIESKKNETGIKKGNTKPSGAARGRSLNMLI